MELVRLAGREVDGGRAADAEDSAAATEIHDAFRDVYLRHREDVFRYLRARLGETEQALEVTAVTFERALVAFHRFANRGAGPLPWLIRIARNAAIDVDRQQGRFEWAHERTEPMSPEPGPEAAAVLADEIQHLRRLVAALPNPARDAIAMRYGSDMSAREIALVLGKSEAATHKLLQRTLAQLKEAHRDED